nr:MAG TPA: KilA-N domain [Caudoviricetes sp.]
MTALTIGSSKIRQIDGFYSLNDLHVASGGAEKHQPAFFLRNEQTKALIEEVNSANLQNLNAGNPAIKTERGKYGGTYACKELVIAYAAWISPAFHLKVIRVFLGATRPALPPPSRPVYISAMQQTDINSRAHVIAQQYYSKFRAELMADFAAGKVQDVETWEPAIRQPEKPARKTLAKKYRYPISQINNQRTDLAKRVGNLSLAEMTRPDFCSPLKNLLAELEKDGHDIAGCQAEYQAMRDSLESVSQISIKLLNTVFDLRAIGQKPAEQKPEKEQKHGKN